MNLKRLFARLRKKPPIYFAVPLGAELVQSWLCFQEGRLEQAFSLLNEIKSRRVPHQNTDYLRAQCFLARNCPGDALEAVKEELRYFPDNPNARELFDFLSADRRKKPEAKNAEFRELFATIQPYTMVSEPRLFSLYSLAKTVCEEDLPGNFVECGVAAGGVSGLLAAVIARHTKQKRLLFSCDTFTGMPDSSDLDVHEGKAANASGWGEGTCSAPESCLMDLCQKLGAVDIVRPVKGLFSDTLPARRAEIGPIAMLHMDGDWYASTRDVLQNLYDQVIPQGRIQIDDYGYWDGCKKAVTEFEQMRGKSFQFHPIDESGVWMQKEPS